MKRRRGKPKSKDKYITVKIDITDMVKAALAKQREAMKENSIQKK